jgi:uncharacterized protein (TIGR00369 family)
VNVADIFSAAPCVAAVGIEPDEVVDGRCVSRLEPAERRPQHDGVVHAGGLAAMADHAAGAVSARMLTPGGIVLTTEFRISLLRAARGERHRCRAEVIKPGSRVTFAESTLMCETDGREGRVA